jgi:hypothetical protein
VQGFWEDRAPRCPLAKGTGIMKVAKTVGLVLVVTFIAVQGSGIGTFPLRPYARRRSTPKADRGAMVKMTHFGLALRTPIAMQ